jgi:hypothetical protein
MESQTVEQDRNAALGRYRVLERMTSERLLEVVLDPDTKLSPHHGAILLGVLRDKIQVLSGQATSRVERTETASADSLAALLLAAREAAGRMGFEGDAGGQKGEPARELGPGEVQVGPARAPASVGDVPALETPGSGGPREGSFDA